VAIAKEPTPQRSDAALQNAGEPQRPVMFKEQQLTTRFQNSRHVSQQHLRLGSSTQAKRHHNGVERAIGYRLQVEGLTLNLDVNRHVIGPPSCFSNQYRLGFYSDEGLDNRRNVRLKVPSVGTAKFKDFPGSPPYKLVSVVAHPAALDPGQRQATCHERSTYHGGDPSAAQRYCWLGPRFFGQAALMND
jgi:hypothetical protein